jgi:hypothetical protein
MPRQSDSAENKPGEKAMMRKLAVTVFAFSLAALGCGSDSGTNPVDTGVASEAGKTDVYVAPAIDTSPADAPIGADAYIPLDTAKVDTTAVDGPNGIDQAQVLDTAPGVDGPKGVDAQGIDGPKVQVDGGVDAAKVDTGNLVDAGTAG